MPLSWCTDCDNRVVVNVLAIDNIHRHAWRYFTDHMYFYVLLPQTLQLPIHKLNINIYYMLHRLF